MVHADEKTQGVSLGMDRLTCLLADMPQHICIALRNATRGATLPTFVLRSNECAGTCGAC